VAGGYDGDADVLIAQRTLSAVSGPMLSFVSDPDGEKACPVSGNIGKQA